MMEDFKNIVDPDEPPTVELDIDFLMDELSARLPKKAQPAKGVTKPEQAHIPIDYWPSHGYSARKPTVTPVLPRGLEEESSFNFVRMGGSDVINLHRHARTPQLPSHTRHTRRNKPKMETPQQFISWKYFGETDGRCGCLSAKVRADAPTSAVGKTLSQVPKTQPRIRLSTEQKRKPKAATELRKKRSNTSLFERSLHREPEEEMTLRTFPVDDNVSLGSVRDDEDPEIEAYIECKGKLIPLRSSSMNRNRF